SIGHPRESVSGLTLWTARTQFPFLCSHRDMPEVLQTAALVRAMQPASSTEELRFARRELRALARALGWYRPGAQRDPKRRWQHVTIRPPAWLQSLHILTADRRGARWTQPRR